MSAYHNSFYILLLNWKNVLISQYIYIRSIRNWKTKQHQIYWCILNIQHFKFKWEVIKSWTCLPAAIIYHFNWCRHKYMCIMAQRSFNFSHLCTWICLWLVLNPLWALWPKVICLNKVKSAKQNDKKIILSVHKHSIFIDFLALEAQDY